MTLNRDFFVALFFLFLSISLFVMTYSLPEPMFGQLPSWTWPRAILIPLGLLSLVLLVQSQLAGGEHVSLSSVLEWFATNVRPFICFALFLGFLLTMPILGMLLGGILYVFLTLNVLGGHKPKQLLMHAGISIFFVTAMWSVFALALGVVLPEGTLLRVF